MFQERDEDAEKQLLFISFARATRKRWMGAFRFCFPSFAGVFILWVISRSLEIARVFKYLSG